MAERRKAKARLVRKTAARRAQASAAISGDRGWRRGRAGHKAVDEEAEGEIGQEKGVVWIVGSLTPYGMSHDGMRRIH